MSSVAKSKHVISISLGSSKRDAKAHVRLGDTELLIERLCSSLFAVLHNLVGQLGDDLAVIHRIRKHVTLRNSASSRHNCFLLK